MHLDVTPRNANKSTPSRSFTQSQPIRTSTPSAEHKYQQSVAATPTTEHNNNNPTQQQQQDISSIESRLKGLEKKVEEVDSQIQSISMLQQIYKVMGMI